VEAVLIHKHHARISPRLIPGSSPRSGCTISDSDAAQLGMQDLMRFATRSCRRNTAVTRPRTRRLLVRLMKAATWPRQTKR
jgi:hypothetical protein